MADDVVDELLALPPEEFTAARNAAAKRLRDEGKREEAETVKGLPRPPVALWTLNRLAHEQPKVVAAFLDAVDALREAHAGGGDIRAATGPLRESETAVVHAAKEVARTHGMKPTDTVERALRATLQAASLDAAAAEELRAGRLLREPEPPSLDALLASLPAGAAPAKSAKDAAAERRALDEEIAAAKAAATRARGEARDAAAAADAAQREWERAQKAAEKAGRASDEAAERLQQLQAQRTG